MHTTYANDCIFYHDKRQLLVINARTHSAFIFHYEQSLDPVLRQLLGSSYYKFKQAVTGSILSRNSDVYSKVRAINTNTRTVALTNKKLMRY